MSLLLDSRYFPSYKQLPDEYEVDDYYYIDSGICSPNRHWCFMGEIVDVLFLIRYRLNVKDATGMTINVSFYLDHGESLDGSSLKPGNTIFVRYAKQHFYMDGSVGIRLEYTPSILVLPYSMAVIMKAHRAIVKDQCKKCGKRACKRCAKCKQTLYCTRDCQKDDWENHKSDCGVLSATLSITALDHALFDSFQPLSRDGQIGQPL